MTNSNDEPQGRLRMIDRRREASAVARRPRRRTIWGCAAVTRSRITVSNDETQRRIRMIERRCEASAVARIPSRVKRRGCFARARGRSVAAC